MKFFAFAAGTKVLTTRFVLPVPALTALIVSTLLVSGCDDGGSSSSASEESSGRSLRMVNAVVGSVSIGWEISESDQGSVSYGRASNAISIIDGEKPLTFYQVQADGDLDYFDLAFDFDLEGDSDVLIVLYGTLDSLDYLIIEEETFDLDEDEGRVGLLNLSSAFPSLDLYLTDDEDGVFAATPLVASDFALFSGVETFTEGDFELELTATGDKTIIFDAGAVSIDEDRNHFYLVMDFSSNSQSLILLEVVGSQAGRQLVNEESVGYLRFFNGIADYPAVDVYLGNTSGTPLFENQSFQQLTTHAELDPGAYNVNITPTGVTDTFFFEGQINIVSGLYNTLFVAGLSQDEDVGGNLLVDEVRPIDTGALVSFINASPSNEAVDVYLLLPGQPITDSVPVVSALAPFLSFDFEQEAGEFQLSLIQSSNDAVILSPIPIAFEVGEVTEIFFTDAQGGGTPGEVTVVRTDID
ncbi:MAG: DUF4397 domain-containing protein [Pseudomonadota bacterium]